MKKILFGALIALASVLIYKSCTDDAENKKILKENSMLLQEQLKNVSKLIVTEGNFAEVYNYDDSKELFGPYIRLEKKALVVVNAEVAIAFDMSKLEYDINEDSKTLALKSIPEPEIKISPDFEYYDVTSGYLNPFEAKDYNAIKENVNESLLKKVKQSTLISNAENRLVYELSRLLVLTNSMGWSLAYNEQPIKEVQDLEVFNQVLID
ncbi:DUF4230 domain-containing protein [Croceivirga thetidis]|uniref:DUF4230 domain-containing protein n=1 Tax=Croceivirga thetidis TaxID=2721623 RepID=A0ABX1GSP6_9FLAO|nr:DUF4230 domain-containing protein [Croceivirga thetidis]NKI31782.1 DUF4230 domain-containing protein [Croceivirga thetidis]